MPATEKNRVEWPDRAELNYCRSAQRNFPDIWPALLLLLMVMSGCSTIPGRAPWGSEVHWTPGWQRLGTATLHAATDPLTWAPAAGAAVFTIGDLDENLSDWAVEHRPLFGDRANDASDILDGGLGVIYLGTALASDNDLPGEQWRHNKLQGLGVGLTSELVTGGLTLGLKKLTNRTRPDGGSDKESFPSGHSSLAASLATLSAYNSDSLPLSPLQRSLVKTGSYSLAAATAWARLEAKRHYPSDVLAGLALGHFVARVIQESLMPEVNQNSALDLELDRDRVMVGLRVTF